MTGTSGFRRIWPDRQPLIGMIHLPPLPGAPRWGGSLGEVLDHAVQDATVLAEAGFDGVIVENFGDAPFLRGAVPVETVSSLTRAVAEVRRAVGDLPVGVNVLRNDGLSAVAIAAATGARFVRVNVLVGSMWTDQGLVEGQAAELMRLRSRTVPELAVLADVQVKHAHPVGGSSLATAAADSWHRGLADALIATGSATGRKTAPADVRAIEIAVPDAPVLVGSGLDPSNAFELMGSAAGAIVGTAIMRDGRAGGLVDPARARDLVDAARG